MYWEALQQWLAGTRLVRRLADTLFRGRARRHLAALDHLDAARSQERTLRGLVHRAHATRFGREHDFGRIRTAADFRRLVPLRTPLDFWRDYWQPAFPDLGDVTWPGPIGALASRPSAEAPYLPAPTALWASHRAAAFTTLSLVAAARPQARLFSGRMLLVNEGPPPALIAAGVQAGGAGWLALQDLPPRLRPVTLPAPPCVDPGCSAEGRLRVLARRAARASLTIVAGEAGALERFFEQCKSETGWRHVAEMWPALAAVVYQGDAGASSRVRLAGAVVDGRHAPALLLEACVRPEAAVAVEDPRHGCLRLLPDHGVYFEFVPPEELEKERPVRLGVGDVEPGTPYALAVSSPAGVWACLAGVRVRFERRDPPLLHVLEAPAAGRPATADVEAAHPLQAPHRRSDGRSGGALRDPRLGYVTPSG